MPHSQANYKLEGVWNSAFPRNTLCGGVETLPEGQAHVGREFPADLIPEAKTEFHVVDAAAHTELAVLLERDLRIETRLQYESLR